MNTHAAKTQENKSQSVANMVSQMQGSDESSLQVVDNRPEAVAQRKLQDMANNSQQVSHLRSFQAMANNSPGAKKAAQLQAVADNNSLQQRPIQKKENNTGLPDNLKSGIENLSGYSLDDVKVNYNSNKPTQLQAHAYAQGTEIHLASGQEKHLPHEAWHIVQQKQGRVKPTMQMKGTANVNDNAGLEKEADVMGVKSLQMNPKENESRAVTSLFAEKANSGRTDLGLADLRIEHPTIQRVLDFTQPINLGAIIQRDSDGKKYKVVKKSAVKITLANVDDDNDQIQLGSSDKDLYTTVDQGKAAVLVSDGTTAAEHSKSIAMSKEQEEAQKPITIPDDWYSNPGNPANVSVGPDSTNKGFALCDVRWNNRVTVHVHVSPTYTLNTGQVLIGSDRVAACSGNLKTFVLTYMHTWVRSQEGKQEVDKYLIKPN